MGLVPYTDPNVNGCISVQTRMVHLYQAGTGTKAAVFQRWFLAVQRLVSLTQSPGKAVEIQGGIQTSSAAGLSKYWEGQIDSTLIATALAASEQADRTLALYPSLLRQSVLWKLLGEIDWYNGVLCKV